MWIRKSPSEIAEQDRRARFNPLPAVLWALLIFVLAFITGVGARVWNVPPTGPPLSVPDAFRIEGEFAVVAFIVIYVAQLVFGGWWLRPNTNALYCPRCRAIESKKSRTHCACGEQLELLRNWKWIPDDASAS